MQVNHITQRLDVFYEFDSKHVLKKLLQRIISSPGSFDSESIIYE